MGKEKQPITSEVNEWQHGESYYSARQAWKAYSHGISLEEYARDHSALQEAMDYFGSKS